MYKKLEPLAGKFKGNEFGSLFDDTTLLMNKIGARHTFNPNDKIEAKYAAMTDDELIIWYDRTFHMFLACMAAVPYLDFRAEIKMIKR